MKFLDFGVLLPLLSLTMAFMLPADASAARWSWRYTTDLKAAAPGASIMPFLYGKKWAYAVEIDDGGIGALKTAAPLLARFSYTDAPPGMPGGGVHPFVGGAGVITAIIGTGNSTVMQWSDLEQLKKDGWGIINHSYAHRGRAWGKPPQLLTPGQIRTDLYWSQTILADRIGDGLSPTHFIYPNGYMEYAKYLGEFHLHSGSRVAASRPKITMDVYNPKSNQDDLNRAYLDEGYWTHGGKSNPMYAMPEDGPPAGYLHIDFTHGINADPASANHERWVTRLSTIASRFAAGGRDELWCAPTGQVISYVNARKAARVRVESGTITVELPDDLPGSRLTLILGGVPESMVLKAPPGGLLYRNGATAWITTPMIGLAGSPPPNPRVKCLYSGPTRDLSWGSPQPIAGVRLLQASPPANGTAPQVALDTPQGEVSLQTQDPREDRKLWHHWLLFPVVPDKPAIQSKGIRVTAGKAWPRMEVWVTVQQKP